MAWDPLVWPQESSDDEEDRLNPWACILQPRDFEHSSILAFSSASAADTLRKSLRQVCKQEPYWLKTTWSYSSEATATKASGCHSM